MFRVRDAVKFGECAVCPKCNSAFRRESRAKSRIEKLRARIRAELSEKSARQTMSAFQEHKDELEHYEQMFGRERGRLAVSLDRLTNALVLVGQHGVYCTSQRNPTVPAMDLRMINQELVHAKELVQSVMEELRKAKEPFKN
jgi:hypothetical protein